MNDVSFPFSAVVGQDDLKQALIVNAINPNVGGVLVKGPRGTGKSTLVRGITELMPEQTFRAGCPLRCEPGADYECPVCGEDPSSETRSDRPRFTELPLGASPEQVVGSLNVEAALNESRRELEPGILARANRGILYVDEVNLLSDRLVDLLLDAAASGRHTVERQGISLTHPAEFILVGTMNPEEGSLRPQIRDRFGLCVNSESVVDPETRAELARRADRYDRDPDEFVREWEAEQETLRQKVSQARNLLESVSIAESLGRTIAERVLDAQVAGHRADITIRHTSRALAAWDQRDEVVQEDIERSAELALEHRGSNPNPPRGSSSDGHEKNPFENESSSNGESKQNRTTGESQFESISTSPLILEQADSHRSNSGHKIDSESSLDVPNTDSINLNGTLINTANRTLRENDSTIRHEDLEFENRDRQSSRVTVFMVDTSASMSQDRAISFVKGMVTRTIRDSGQEEMFSLVEFRATGGRTVVAPTPRHRNLLRELETLPVGGNTPIVEGTRTVLKQIDANERLFRNSDSRLVVVSDGRFPISESLLSSMRHLNQKLNVQFVEVDQSDRDWGSMRELAKLFDCRISKVGRNVA